MNDALPAVIQELAPTGLRPDPGSLQEMKSSKMRETILEATLDCLMDHGYAGTTHCLICTKAKISRGALLHHYPTTNDLITAVIDYAFYRHMVTFNRFVMGLGDENRKDRNEAIAIDWQMCLSREMTAYLELRTAARTNNELAAIFLPRAKHHDLVWKEELLRVFPEWCSDLDRFHLSRRFIRALIEGMAMSRSVWQDTDTEWALVTLLADLVRKIRIGEFPLPSPEAIKEYRGSTLVDVKPSKNAARRVTVGHARNSCNRKIPT